MMKNALLILMLIFFYGTSSCGKKELAQEFQFESTGKILGMDNTMCPCCGGWILEIDGDNNFYRFEELPEGSNIDLSDTNINVKLDWDIDRECNSIIYINIEAIELN